MPHSLINNVCLELSKSLVVIAAVWLCAGGASADKATVLLRNGGRVTGDVVVYLPNDRITLDVGRGERMTFAAADIASVRMEERAGAAVDAQPASRVHPKASRDHAEPMDWLGLGVKLGFAGLTRLDGPGLDLRAAVRLAFPINMGGGRFGWVVEPSFGVGPAELNLWESGADYVSSGIAIVGGVYAGPTINMRLRPSFYLGVGGGVQVSVTRYRVNTGAPELDARMVALATYVPLTATVYVTPQIALVVGIGLGFGGGFLNPVSTDIPDHQSTIVAYDASVGLRWP